MRICDYLNEEQIGKIKSVIRIQCEQAARNDAVERNRISADLYDKLKKGRKAHDLTGDIYVALFYQENTIEGLNLEVTSNGIYTQPELVGENVLIHIYHQTNKLNSKLVQDRIACDKPFFCIRYDVDKTYRLKSIEAVHAASGEIENLYTATRVVQMAG